MTKKALIKVTGIQRLGKEKDKIELTTVGTMEDTDESVIFRYKEEQEPPEAPVEASLVVYKNGKRVDVVRSGPFGSLLIIENAKRNVCSYGSPYGDMLMGIYGRSIESKMEEKRGSVSFLYDLDINGALASHNEVKLEYKIH